MRLRRLESELWVPHPIDEVFAFFADASNLDAITPAWLRFQIDTPSPIEMQVGTLIDYKLRIRGIPVRWQSEITVWDPPFRFVDEQRRGPYRKWHHVHSFVERDGGTFIRDEVDYAVPGWVLEPLIHRWFVRRDVERIFAHRTAVLRQRFHRRAATAQV
ncbi:MAG: SRPBCC family protein [Planctomycetes bacterium]|nr:SRPBCC family protein [Planctomycetota bacterium]